MGAELSLIEPNAVGILLDDFGNGPSAQCFGEHIAVVIDGPEQRIAAIRRVMVATFVPFLASSAMKAQMASGATGQAFRPRAVPCREQGEIASVGFAGGAGMLLDGELMGVQCSRPARAAVDGRRAKSVGQDQPHRSSENGSYRKPEPAFRPSGWARRFVSPRTSTAGRPRPDEGRGDDAPRPCLGLGQPAND